MALTHYIIVRRDLPLGMLAAQVAHAAGESFYLFAAFNSSVLAAFEEFGRGLDKYERPDSSTRAADVNPRGAGSTPAPGSSFKLDETIACVLGARNSGRLDKLHRRLCEADILHVLVVETDGEYAGQPMAIGLYPRERTEALDKLLGEYHRLSECADASDGDR